MQSSEALTKLFDLLVDLFFSYCNVINFDFDGRKIWQFDLWAHIYFDTEGELLVINEFFDIDFRAPDYRDLMFESCL